MKRVGEIISLSSRLEPHKLYVVNIVVFFFFFNYEELLNFLKSPDLDSYGPEKLFYKHNVHYQKFDF